MILADTSVWVDHLGGQFSPLERLLRDDRIVGHTLVAAEIGLGSLKTRSRTMELLDSLPQAPVADPDEVRTMVEQRSVFSRGIGYVDAALLTSCLLAPGLKLCSQDRRLVAVARELGLLWRGEA